MVEKERVEEIRFFLKKNKTEFAKVLGYTTPQSYTNYQSSNGGSISIKMIRALKDYDSRISTDWILTGQGQMLLNNESSSNSKNIYGDGNNTQIGHFNNSSNSDNKNISVNSNNNELELLKKENKSLNKEIKSLNRVIESQEKLISVLEKNQK